MRQLWVDYKIIIIYLIIGGLWILFSDRAIVTFTQSPAQITLLQTYKGWGFIIATAVLLLVIVHRDLIHRARILKELEEARDRAESADRIKSAFLNNMSHEVRTPMNAIIGFSELLNDPGIKDDERSNYVGIIQRSGHQLVDLITNIADASALQVNQADLVQSSFNLNDLIDELALEGQVMLESFSQHRTQINAIKPLPRDAGFIIADYGKISRVLYHLLQNAIKNTPEGEVDIGYGMQDESRLRLFVKDTGVGMPEGVQQQFEPFRNLQEQHEMTKGAGLGLNIVKGFIELMGGEVNINSRQKQGTVVSIQLPLVRDSGRNIG